MFAILRALGMFIADLFKSRCRLEAENLLLRHQLAIALRRAPPCLRLLRSDRVLLVWITRLWPSLFGAVQLVQPEAMPPRANQSSPPAQCRLRNAPSSDAEINRH
jgi:hypothetical protein